MRRLAWVGALVAASLPAQEPAWPALEALVPDEWARQDLETRWVTYRTDLERRAADKDRKAKWARWLGERGDFDLLEGMALYEGWDEAGAELRRREAPQWMRAALWNLASSDSHDTGAARKALEADADLVLGWVKRFPIARRGEEVEAFLVGLERVAQARDPGRLLPPLDDAAVLLSYFDAPKALAVLEPGARVEAGQRYLHQVVRALRGARTRAAFIAPHVAKIANLLAHPHATVRAEAATALSTLPGHLVPCERLMQLASEAQDAALRRLASLALSFSTHPAAFFAVHDIAGDASHPGMEAARQRLALLGDEFTVAWMAKTQLRLPEVAAALAAAMRDSDEATQRWRLQVTFERAAWAVASEHAAASLAIQSLNDAVFGRVPRSRAAVEALRLEVDATRWDPGVMRGEVRQAMVRLRDNLLRELGNKR